MKEQILELIEQIPSIEAKFHTSSASAGLIMPSVSEIGDVPEFQAWVQNIQLALQDIVDRTEDKFVADTLAVAKARYDGWHDRKNFDMLKGKLLAISKNIEKYYPAGETIAMLEKSHQKSSSAIRVETKRMFQNLSNCLTEWGLIRLRSFAARYPDMTSRLTPIFLIT